jgi:hypothetical protein
MTTIKDYCRYTYYYRLPCEIKKLTKNLCKLFENHVHYFFEKKKPWKLSATKHGPYNMENLKNIISFARYKNDKLPVWKEKS